MYTHTCVCFLKLGAARTCFFLVVSLGIVAVFKCTASCCFSVCPKVSASEQTWAGLGVECDDPLASLTKTTLRIVLPLLYAVRLAQRIGVLKLQCHGHMFVVGKLMTL